MSATALGGGGPGVCGDEAMALYRLHAVTAA